VMPITTLNAPRVSLPTLLDYSKKLALVTSFTGDFDVFVSSGVFRSMSLECNAQRVA